MLDTSRSLVLGIHASMLAGCTIVGLAAEAMGLIKAFYASPYVAVTAGIALHSGRRAGYAAAGVSAALFNLMFVAPRWAFTVPTPEEMTAYLSMFAVAYLVGSRSQPAPLKSRYAGTLPFVSTDRHSSWDVGATRRGWSDDCDLGREYGRIYLERLSQPGAPLIGWIVRDMTRTGSYSGVEAGFMSAIATELERSRTYQHASDCHSDRGVIQPDGDVVAGPVRRQE